MPQTDHVERHFAAGQVVRDVVIGMSDGLTVPFALAAGLSGAVAASRIVVTAGLAEIAAGSIAMGLGGYLAARSDAEHYANEKHRELTELKEIPEAEANEVRDILINYGLADEEADQLTAAMMRRTDTMVDFMMRFELGLEEPDPERAMKSALTIGGSYAVGGFIPLFPYLFVTIARDALPVSVVVTLIALMVFGFVKGHFTGAGPIKSAVQTTVIGGIAAMAAFLIARAVS